MLPKILRILFFLSLSLIISGCSVTTLDIVHNSKTKTTIVNIGNEKKYQIDNSELVGLKDGAETPYSGGYEIERYLSEGVCNNILFQKLPPLQGKSYYGSFAKEDIYKQFKGYNCSTEVVDGLEFHDCESRYAVIYEDYRIKDGFLSEKKYLYTDSKECFNNLKLTALKKIN